MYSVEKGKDCYYVVDGEPTSGIRLVKTFGLGEYNEKTAHKIADALNVVSELRVCKATNGQP